MHDTTEQVTTRGRQHGGLFAGLLGLGFFLALLWGGAGHASSVVFTANSTEEYQRKAEFVLNFCRLSDSPSMPFQSPDSNFILGILGEDPLGPFIGELAGEKCVGHTIKVVHYSTTDDYTQSRVLFIGNSEQHNLDAILSSLEGKRILTIADFEGFAKRGGMFEFSYQELPESTIENARKVRFRVNPGAAEAAHIHIGVTLTKLGEVVQTEREASKTGSDRINIAILPPWEFHLPNVSGIGEGFYQSLEENQAFRITHAFDRDLAHKLGAEQLTVSDSDRKRIWKQLGRLQNSEPVVEAVREIVKGTGVRAVFMYSSPADYYLTKYAYLVDLESDKVYRIDRSIVLAAGGDYAHQTKELGDELLSNYLEDRDKIRIAVLPSWEFYIATQVQETGRDIYRSLGLNEDISIEYAAGKKLAKKLGTQPIEIDKSEQARLWKKASKAKHSTPNLEVIEQLVNGLNLDAVFMYSLPADWGPGARVYMVDLKSGRIYQNTKSHAVLTTGHGAFNTDSLVGELLSNYLEDRNKIRIAILPARNLNRTNLLKSEAVFMPLGDNNDVLVTHVAEKKLARDMGAKELKTSRSQEKGIWNNAGFDQNTEPDIEAVIAMAKNLDVRLALMYSYPHSEYFQSRPHDLQLYLVDVETGELFVSERALEGSHGSKSESVKDMANNLIRDYLEDRNRIRVAVLPSWEHYIAPQVRQLGRSIYRSLGLNEEITVEYAMGEKLADELGTRPFAMKNSEKPRLWKEASKFKHSEPDVEAIRQLVKGQNLDAVFMYSLPADWASGARVFMIDLESGRVIENTESYQGIAPGTLESIAKFLVDGLVSSYLQDSDRQPE